MFMHYVIQCYLSPMAKRWMPDIVGEGDGFNQIIRRKCSPPLSK
jgi:hypothetical protein